MPFSLRERLTNKGTSLVEILLVLATVGFLVLLTANIPNSIGLIGKAGRQSLALEIASKQIETKRAISYINLTNGEESVADSRLASLPVASGQIKTSDCDLSICPNGERIKKIAVTISWKETGQTQTVKLDTLISEGGLNQ